MHIVKHIFFSELCYLIIYMRTIIFIGRHYPPKILKSINEDSKGQIGLSTHNYEESFIDGLSTLHDTVVKVIVNPAIPSFPHNFKRCFIKREQYKIQGIDVTSIPVFNLLIINRIWSLLCLIYAIFYTLKGLEDKDEIVIINNIADLSSLAATRIVKKISSLSLNVFTIVLDIPIDVTLLYQKSIIKASVVGYFDKEKIRLAKKSDYRILLTKQMESIIPGINTIVEGMIKISSYSNNIIRDHKPDKEIIAYTGSVQKVFGVWNLVEAFRIANLENAELWICGSGDLSKELEELSRNVSNIKYYGLVDSEKAKQIQIEATILVNPRTSEGEYTKYSFPSKTIEYLITGRTVVGNKLEGIPEEYFQYVYTPVDESVYSLSECLKKVVNCPWEERFKKQVEGRNFIIDNKNSSIQVRRIIDNYYKFKIST